MSEDLHSEESETTIVVEQQANVPSVIKPFDVAVQDLKQMAADSKIVVTKDTLAEAKKLRKKLKDQRCAIQNLQKENNENLYDLYKTAKANQETQAAELIALISPTEDYLDEGIKKIEKEEEERKAKKAKELEEKIANRNKELYDFGMKFDGSNFVYGSQSISPVQVRALDDAEFETAMEGVKAEYNKEQERKAEVARVEALYKKRYDELLTFGYQCPLSDLGTLTDDQYADILDDQKKAHATRERLKKEEVERLEKVKKEQEEERQRLEDIKKENEAKEQKLKEEEERIAKEKANKEKEQADREAKLKEQEAQMKADLEALKKQKIENRQSQLMNLGLIFIGDGGFAVACEDKQVIVSESDILSLSDLEWPTFIKGITPEVVAINERLLEIAAAELAEKNKKEAEEKELAAKAEAARQEALRPDKDKLILFAEKIMNIEMPTLTDGASINILTESSGMLTKINNYILKAVEELK